MFSDCRQPAVVIPDPSRIAEARDREIDVALHHVVGSSPGIFLT